MRNIYKNGDKMADHNEVLKIIVLVFIIAMPMIFISKAWDEATDPSTDPHSGDKYDSGISSYNYDKEHKVEPPKPHEDVDLGPSSNPQVEAG